MTFGWSPKFLRFNILIGNRQWRPQSLTHPVLPQQTQNLTIQVKIVKNPSKIIIVPQHSKLENHTTLHNILWLFFWYGLSSNVSCDEGNFKQFKNLTYYCHLNFWEEKKHFLTFFVILKLGNLQQLSKIDSYERKKNGRVKS